MVYLFNTNKVPKLSQVGGKGRALIQTYKAGFPVPEGLVLSVDFFADWLNEIKKSNEWIQLMNKGVNLEICDALKEKASALKFNENMQSEIDSNLAKLKDDAVFAVRSSSPEEDLEGTSFAGMYETFLGVTKDKLSSKVSKAFASMFDIRVMKYKEQHEIDLNKACIAVVIQRQIASDVSGVGFSLNPLNNCYDEVFINASFGLGEAIVSGIVSPDTYIVDFTTKSIIEKQINKKEISLCLNMLGGIIQKKNENPKLQALTDNQIVELAILIKKCETYYGKPMDTEWAFENGKLYLLQSRPITTYVPLFNELVTKAGERKNIYIDVMGLTQGFTESMSVLGIELWGRFITKIKGDFMPTTIDGIMPAIHGRQYINVSNMLISWGNYATKKFLYGYDENVKKILEDIDLVNKYKPLKIPKALKGIKVNMIKMIFTMMPSGIKAKFSDYKASVDEYKSISSHIILNLKNINSKTEFNKIVDDSMSDLKKLINSMGIMVAGMSAYSSIKKMFKDKDVSTLITALGMDLEGNPTSKMGYLLFKLASYDEFQSTKTKDEFITKIKEKSYSNEFMKNYYGYLNKFGGRGFKEIDVASKRVYEDPTILYEKLKNININDSQISNVKAKRKEAYNKLLVVAKKGGFDKKFKKQAEIYQATFGYREHPKYTIVVIVSKIHDIALEIGEKFVQQGRLEDKWDIFDLHIDEITKAQSGGNIDLKAAKEKNLIPYKKTQNVKDWPLVIDSRGKIFKPKLNIKDGDLKGSAIAPGIVRGKAKVLRTPYEKPLNEGEILVTKATEPSWTPIFINAKGVVMEIGGPLQHGGIIAREYGIPCVSGLLGIMDIVKDGDMLEVDGNSGVVRIIEKNDNNKKE